MTSKEIISRERAFVMGVSMIAIILFHQPYVQTLATMPFGLFGHWGVDLFFFISGMGIYVSLSKNALNIYLKHRVARILPAYLIAGILMGLGYVLLNHVSFTVYFTNDLWFIKAIACFYLMAPILKKFLDKWGVKFMAVVICVCWCTCASVYFMGSHITQYTNPFFLILAAARLPVFALGMVFAGNQFSWNSNTVKWCLLFLPLAIVARIIHVFVPLNQVFPNAGLIFLALQFLFIMPVTPTIFKMLGELGELVLDKLGPVHKCVSFFGLYSLEIYLWHEWIFAHSHFVLGDYGRDLYEKSICLILTVSFSLILAWGLHRVCRPFSRIAK